MKPFFGLLELSGPLRSPQLLPGSVAAGEPALQQPIAAMTGSHKGTASSPQNGYSEEHSLLDGCTTLLVESLLQRQTPSSTYLGAHLSRLVSRVTRAWWQGLAADNKLNKIKQTKPISDGLNKAQAKQACVTLSADDDTEAQQAEMTWLMSQPET